MSTNTKTEYLGAEIVLECLLEQDVDTIFGYPGGAVIPLYDALYDYKDKLKHILTCHEQGASHAADGYARTTGKVGVLFATSGPGATNTVTGIATAYSDSVPMVVFTGQVPNTLLGRNSFQEVDIVGIAQSITKHSYLVKSIDELASTIREAFKIATSDRPGPVLIDIPKDVQVTKSSFEAMAIKNQSDHETICPDESLASAIEAINSAKRPVIYAGGGVIMSNASKDLFNFATKGDIPVVSTLMGLGNFPRDHKLSLGILGMHGARETNLAVQNSDLVIAIGARFSDRVIGNRSKFAPDAKILHIDIDQTEIGKNIEAHMRLIGDVKDILGKIMDQVIDQSRDEWLKEIKSWEAHYSGTANSFTPKNILNKVNSIIGDNSTVATDVGQHQMWTAQFWKFKEPRTFASSGGLGTMGYGLGAAIGAKVGNPDKRSILITGDGSFRMNCNELPTLAKYNLPVTIVMLKNNTLGMVRQWQRLFQEARFSETDLGDEVDFVKLAAASSIEGHRVRSLQELEKAIELTKDKNAPIFIECVIDKDESVYPIVPPGMPINDLILK